MQALKRRRFHRKSYRFADKELTEIAGTVCPRDRARTHAVTRRPIAFNRNGLRRRRNFCGFFDGFTLGFGFGRKTRFVLSLPVAIEAPAVLPLNGNGNGKHERNGHTGAHLEAAS